MRYIHEISAALSLLLLLLIPIPLFRRVPTVVKWLAAFGMVAIVLSGLLVRGFTGRDPLDLAGEYLVDGICSVHDFGACRNRRAKVEEEAKEQARQKAAEEARLKATEEARLKATEEARLKAAEEARLKAAEEARLKAAEEARLKAAEKARLKAAEEARLKADEEAHLKAAEEARLRAAEEARAVEERRRQKEGERKARTYRTNMGSPSPPQAPSSGGCPGWMFVGQTCTRPDGKVCTQQPGYNKRTCE